MTRPNQNHNHHKRSSATAAGTARHPGQQDKANQTRVRYHTVPEDHSGQRIDNYLLALFGNVPRTLIYRWLRKGEVRCNKGRVRPTTRVQGGDVLRLPPMSDSGTRAAPAIKTRHSAWLEARILYEDDDFLVMNKPGNMAVHGGSGIQAGLIERLRALRPEARKLELVHRLDRETSGCLLIAKKHTVLRAFHQQFRDHKMGKVYHALVRGCWPGHCQRIDAPLQKNHRKSGERMVTVSSQGKTALTTARPLRTGKAATLMELTPHSGRTHQLRVHCQHIGHPIIGDNKYNGDTPATASGTGAGTPLLLHARRLTLTLPGTSRQQSFQAPYDKAFEQALHNLDTLL